MVTAWPLTSGCSKLRRTVKSCWLREAGICLPAPSTTRDTLSALFSSKAAEVMLSSRGVKRTVALAVRVWAAGETSASMVYCSTSMRERRSCARAADAPSARVRTRARLRLRNMCDVSFQYLLYGQRRALGRSGAAGQLLAYFGQPGLHFGAGAVVGEQAQGLAREIAAGHLTLHEFRHDGASGDEVHHGIAALGSKDQLPGAVAQALVPAVSRLVSTPLSERAQRIAAALREIGASFFAPLHQASGGGFPGDTQAALWELVWAGVVTNDTLHPLRNLLYAKDAERSRRELRDGPPGSPEFLRRFRARTGGSHAAEGRWSLVATRVAAPITPTEWSANIARQLLARNAIVMRETAIAEGIPGGCPAIYPTLKTMEENGSVRRGMFVAGMGAAQFAHTSAIDMLRSLRTEPERPEALHLAASDPANPYGSLLPWPSQNHSQNHTMSRAAGGSVVLIDGTLAAFLRRRNPAIQVILPENEPERS